MEFPFVERISPAAFSELLWKLAELERDHAVFSPLRLVSATAFMLWMRRETQGEVLETGDEGVSDVLDSVPPRHVRAPLSAGLAFATPYSSWFVGHHDPNLMLRTLAETVTMGAAYDEADLVEDGIVGPNQADGQVPIGFFPALKQAVSIGLEEVLALTKESRILLWQFASEFFFQEPGVREAAARGLAEMISQAGRRRPEAFEMFSPEPVIGLMAQFAALVPEDSVYDPCCGGGGLLLQCAEFAKAPGVKVQGGEINEVAFAFAFARLSIAGIRPALKLGNSLLSLGEELRGSGEDFPGNLSNAAGEHDVVVMNPPWSARLHNLPGFPGGRFPGSSEQAFLIHGLRHLRPGGRLIICLPENFLFSGSARRVRERLLKQFTIEAVIALPERTFEPYAHVRASVLVIRNTVNGGTRPIVRFAEIKSFAPDEDYGRLARRVIAGHSGLTWDRPVEELLASDSQLVVRRPFASPFDVLREQTQGRADVNWIELRALASVQRGLAVPSLVQASADVVTADDGVPLLKMSDFDRATGQFKVPDRWVWKKDLTPRHEQRRLKADDFLITIDGTIGRCLTVGPKWAGALVYPSLAIVRPLGLGQAAQATGISLTPGYLSAILSSRAFEEWAQNQAVGSGVRHLQTSVLERFQVPLLPFAQQEQLVVWSQQGFDALGSLQKLLNETNGDPLTEWLSGNEDLRQITVPALGLSDSLKTLERAVKSLLQMRNEVVHGRQLPRSPWILQWITPLESSLQSVRELSDVPDSVARWALLGDALTVWNSALADLNGETTDLDLHITKESAREITSRLIELAVEERGQLLRESRVEVVPEGDTITAGQGKLLTLDFWNRGALPLRSFEATIEVESLVVNNAQSSPLATKSVWPSDCSGITPYLADQPLNVFFHYDLDTVVTEVILSASWHATDFAGRTIADSVRVPLIASLPASQPIVNVLDGSNDLGGQGTGSDKENTAVRSSRSLGPTPYLKGSSVPGNRPDLLFGRDEKLQEALDTLLSPVRAGIVIIEGNRRIGKTSLLSQIARKCAETFLVIACSLQDGRSPQGESAPILETREFYRVLCVATADALSQEGMDVFPPGAPISNEEDPDFRKFERDAAIEDALETISHPAALWDFYLRKALHYTGSKDSNPANSRGVLLLLDEFDKLPQSIEAKSCEAMVPENLRAQLQSHARFTAVIAGSQGLKRMRETHLNPIFGLGKTVELDHLDFIAAESLVTTMARGEIAFAPDATRRVVQLCDGRPYFLQGLCDALWNRGQRSVTLSLVEDVARTYAATEEALTDLWSDAGQRRTGEMRPVPCRRQLLLALSARQQGQGESLRLETFERMLESVGVTLPPDEFLGDDLDALCDLKLLRQEKGIYRFTLPLLATWIAQEKDFESIASAARHEADRLL